VEQRHHKESSNISFLFSAFCRSPTLPSYSRRGRRIAPTNLRRLVTSFVRHLRITPPSCKPFSRVHKAGRSLRFVTKPADPLAKTDLVGYPSTLTSHLVASEFAFPSRDEDLFDFDG